ncbi:uncharacterized protein LOC131875908 [Cryptomeria japonica]|uniref:uncharacterized protein LOC131875908 n=1 Tax=Cryptomeria japonica TaxID=3369 RepID=UPI0027DA68D2|nr:uncharacterized protein LOC131875908 [Cryptomeria japonica]
MVEAFIFQSRLFTPTIVDDTILLGSATVHEARSFKGALKIYTQAFGQIINWNKKSIFFINTPPQRKRKIAHIIGCVVDSFPSIYLGLPQGLSPPDTFWRSIVDRFNKKLARWKVPLLSQARKLQLLKSSLQNLPVYALSLFMIPSKFVEAIEKIHKIFLCSGVEDRRRIPLVAWEKVCLPKALGGLGLTDIKDFNNALLAKRVWRTYGERNKWNSVWFSKYLNGVPNMVSFFHSYDIPHGFFICNSILKAKKVVEAGAGWAMI